VVEQPPQYEPVARIYRDDIVRIDEELAGLNHPTRQGQRIAHTWNKPPPHDDSAWCPIPRTVLQLWALPVGHYTDRAPGTRA
jgi:hypothetical protein